MSKTVYRSATIILLAFCAYLLLAFIVRLLGNWPLGDFAATFYPAAKYFLRGENAYINDFTYVFDGTQHPPYNPIWILLAAVPFGGLSLQSADALRFLMDLGMISLSAYLCTRWVGIHDIARMVLLAIAPWFIIVLNSGQWSSLALVGMLLCFWGLKRDDVTMISAGVLLAAARPQITELVVLATLLLAWRQKILLRVIGLTMACVIVFSLAQPAWFFDLISLYVDRFVHPRPLDSILLLPGWPWLHLVVIGASAVGIALWAWRAQDPQPSTWLWASLAGVGLVSALHEFTYDWIILMMPLAWLLRERRAIVLVIALYLYTFAWALIPIGATFTLPSPIVLPFLIVSLVILWRFLPALAYRVGTNFGHQNFDL